MSENHAPPPPMVRRRRPLTENPQNVQASQPVAAPLVPASTAAPTVPPLPIRNPADPARATAALASARRVRAEYLVALAEGILAPVDVVLEACTPTGLPLRRISLRQLHLSQPGWGERRTSTVLSALAATIGTDEPLDDKTIAWLIDPRSGGRRFLAWLDVQKAKRGAPWSGFPMAPAGPSAAGKREVA